MCVLLEKTLSRPRSPRCRLLLQSPSLASVPGPLLRLEWPSVVGGVGRGSFCCLLWPFSCPSTVGCEERVTGQMAAAAGRASAGQPGRCSVRVGPGRGAGSCPRSCAPGPCGQCGPLACARKRPHRPASGTLTPTGAGSPAGPVLGGLRPVGRRWRIVTGGSRPVGRRWRIAASGAATVPRARAWRVRSPVPVVGVARVEVSRGCVFFK